MKLILLFLITFSPWMAHADALSDMLMEKDLRQSAVSNGAADRSFNQRLYHWISVGGVTYGLRKRVTTSEGDVYTAVSTAGHQLAHLDTAVMNHLIRTYEMSDMGYLQGQKRQELLLLQKSILEVSTRSHQIEVLSKLQNTLIQSGVIATAAYFGKGDTAWKILGNALIDELKNAILQSPQIAANEWGHAVVSASSDRLDRLIAFNQHRNRQQAGESPQNPLSATVVQKRYRDAVWVDAYAIPAAQLIIATQTKTDATSQFDRMLGVVRDGAINYGMGGKTKHAIEILLKAGSMADALATGLPAFKTYAEKVKQRLQHWKNSRTGLGDTTANNITQSATSPATRSNMAGSGTDYLVLYHNNALHLIRNVLPNELDITYNTAFDLEGGDNLFRVFLLDHFHAGMSPRDLTASNILAASEPRAYKANLKLLDLMLTLHWNTRGSDVDIHLMPQTMSNFSQLADCFYRNCFASVGIGQMPCLSKLHSNEGAWHDKQEKAVQSSAKDIDTTRAFG